MLSEDLLHAPDRDRRSVGDRASRYAEGAGFENRPIPLSHCLLERCTRVLGAAPERAELAHGGRPLGGIRHKHDCSGYRFVLDSRSQRQSGPAALKRPGPGTTMEVVMHIEPNDGALVVTVTLNAEEAELVRSALAERWFAQSKRVVEEVEEALSDGRTLPLQDATSMVREMAVIVGLFESALGFGERI